MSWGAHELVIAACNLLAAALKEPLNQKFILLSESGLPLYPPTTTYLQLMHEDKSRLDSCGMGVRPYPQIARDIYERPLSFLHLCRHAVPSL